MKNVKRLSICVIVVVALTVYGQTPQKAKLSADERLERLLPGGQIEYRTTVDIFHGSLGAVGMPGGATQILGCEQDNMKRAWSPLNKSLRQALDAIVETDTRYRWQIADGVINLLPAEGEPALLRTRIRKFHVTDVTSALDALNQLIALPEVKEGMDALHLKPGIAAISYWSSPNPKPFSVAFKNVTLRQALNAIAAASGKHIWDYVETHCNERNEVVIRF